MFTCQPVRTTNDFNAWTDSRTHNWKWYGAVLCYALFTFDHDQSLWNSRLPLNQTTSKFTI
jgi:hypothetical protein